MYIMHMFAGLNYSWGTPNTRDVPGYIFNIVGGPKHFKYIYFLTSPLSDKYMYKVYIHLGP